MFYRNTGIGTCSSMARVGAVLAPIIGREVGRVNRDLVFVIFSVASLLSGFLTLFLPETRGKTLPDSIEDGELWLDESYFQGVKFWNCLHYFMWCDLVWPHFWSWIDMMYIFTHLFVLIWFADFGMSHRN